MSDGTIIGKNGRGNRAAHSKESILAHTKNLLKALLPAIQRMPKIERIEGAPQEMKRAAFDIIGHFTTAWYCPEARNENIRRIFADYGKMMAAFEIIIQQGLITDSAKLAIAIEIERIEEGVVRWRNSLRSASASGAGECSPVSTNE